MNKEKNKMKKWIFSLIAVVLILSLAACGGGNNKKQDSAGIERVVVGQLGE